MLLQESQIGDIADDPFVVIPPFVNEATKSLIEDLYGGLFDGFGISKKEKRATNNFIRELDGFGSATYGEITADSVSQLIDLLNIRAQDVFFDLGCGVGKAVIQVALETHCKLSVGVELSKSRYGASIQAKSKLIRVMNRMPRSTKRLLTLECGFNDNSDHSTKITSNFTGIPEILIPSDRTTVITGALVRRQRHLEEVFHEFNPNSVEFRHEDIFDTDVSNATAIYWSNVCFPVGLFDDLLSKLKDLKVGTRLLTLRKLCYRHNIQCAMKQKPCCHFKLLTAAYINCSWTQRCTAFLYEKL